MGFLWGFSLNIANIYIFNKFFLVNNTTTAHLFINHLLLDDKHLSIV